jgi:hypothetical protein
MAGAPQKHTAPWFKHDNDMRNDLKIKALRRRFGLEGYAIYNMLLEVLSDSDYYAFEFNEHTLEMLSGDFDYDCDKLKEIIDYCLSDRSKLFFFVDGFLRNKTLEDRMLALDIKRERDRDRKKAIEPKEEKPSNGVLKSLFNEFWDIYPVQRRREKQKCQEKFLAKCNKLKAFPEKEAQRAIEALQKYLASEDFVKNNYKYVQLITTWINKWDLDTWLNLEEEETQTYKKLG